MSISHVGPIMPTGGTIPARNCYVATGGLICCCGEKDNIKKTVDMRGRPRHILLRWVGRECFKKYFIGWVGQGYCMGYCIRRVGRGWYKI
jgi:hypothetical protein